MLRAGGITLLRKRIAYLEKEIPQFEESSRTYEPHIQVVIDKKEELERMKIILEELLQERIDKGYKKPVKKPRQYKSFFQES